MNKRQTQLTEIDSFIQKTDAEVTLVLQNLQWDRQQILKGSEMVTCTYNKGHSIPAWDKAEHEDKCFLRSHDYSSEDKLLPDPADFSNVVKFDEMEISHIIENAARTAPLFIRGPGIRGPPQPLSVDRLQATFTSDERRAIHDAVVAAAPALDCRPLELKMASGGDKSAPPADRAKSHAELLAELRNMKRRRTKYRVGAKTKNYSDALRDVIQTQMELYSGITIKTEPDANKPNETYPVRNSNVDNYNKSERDRYREPTTSHTARLKYEHKERDRSQARFNERNRDTRYDKDSDYKGRDRSISRNNETEKHREIKKETADVYSNDEDLKERHSDSRGRDRQFTTEKHETKRHKESEKDKIYKEEKRESDRPSKSNDGERTDKQRNKYCSSKYKNNYKYEKDKFSKRSIDEEKRRRSDKYGRDKGTEYKSGRDYGRYRKD